jgi:hypothetical protein
LSNKKTDEQEIENAKTVYFPFSSSVSSLIFISSSSSPTRFGVFFYSVANKIKQRRIPQIHTLRDLLANERSGRFAALGARL